MADDPQIGQDEIEALLKQAQGEAAGEKPAETEKPKPKAEPEPTAKSNDDLGQDEIEALLNSAGGSPEPPAAKSAPAMTAPPPQAPPKKPKRDDSGDDIAQDDIELLLQQAQAAIASVDQPAEPAAHVQQFRLRDFAGASASDERSTLELIRDVELDLKIELGRTHMPLEEVLRLRKGSVVPLEKLAGDPVDIFVNGRLIARGEVLVMNDNFCVRVAELVASEAVA